MAVSRDGNMNNHMNWNEDNTPVIFVAILCVLLLLIQVFLF